MTKEELEKRIADLEQEKLTFHTNAQAQLYVYEGRLLELKEQLNGKINSQ